MKMRNGYTTGSCATAGAKAGILAILGKPPETVHITIPRGDSLEIPVNVMEVRRDPIQKAYAVCSVTKDGGDDPDVTHGADIITKTEIINSGGRIEISGGEGVGKVTKPGLGLDIGGPAINPVPQRMIAQNLMETATAVVMDHGVMVTISVPRGRELAPKTDNPRLGIINGISILGTSGIVVPFSTASYAASIRQSLDVAVAAGDDTVVLTTGGRSEEFAKQIITLDDHCFVQMGDFSGYTIQQCAKKSIKKAYVVGFVGKLAKMADGIKQTHVKGSKVNMRMLAELARSSGASDSTIGMIRKANTARHVMEIIRQGGPSGFFNALCDRVHAHMRRFSNQRVDIEVILFGFDGALLGKSQGILSTKQDNTR